MTSAEAKHLYVLLKNKLYKDGIKVKWWVENHLPELKYNSAMAQLNGFNPMSEYVEKTIREYLEK